MFEAGDHMDMELAHNIAKRRYIHFVSAGGGL